LTAVVRGAHTARMAVHQKLPYQAEYWTGDEILVPGLAHLGEGANRRALPGGYAAEAHPDCWEILLVTRGEAEWWAEDERYRVRGGELTVLRPGERHGGSGGVMHACAMRWAIFHPDAAGRIAGLTRAETAPLVAALGRMPRVARAPEGVAEALARLIAEHRTRDAASPLCARAALIDLIARAPRGAATGAAGDARIARALAAIDQHLDRPLTIAGLARRSGLAATAFRARFVAATGTTPQAWIRRRRIDRARALLADRRASLAAIALACGFSSGQHLATAFKALTGQTPRDHRRSLR